MTDVALSLFDHTFFYHTNYVMSNDKGRIPLSSVMCHGIDVISRRIYHELQTLNVLKECF